jgi:hypothetical protein
MSEATVSAPVTDPKQMLMQMLATLPGHITGGAFILYLMFVFMPERDAQQAALLTKQSEVHVAALEKQRGEFLEAQRVSTENFEKTVRRLQDSCYEIRTVLKDGKK